MADIAILVEGKYVDPKTTDWYTNNVLAEDRILIDALKNQGFSAEKIDWSAVVNWSNYKAVIFSSVWDYFHRYAEFCLFLQEAQGQTLFVNPIELIQWNMDKHYLNDLKLQNVPVVTSHFIEKGTTKTLLEIHEQVGWNKTVIKPRIAGAARHTYLLTPNNYDTIEPVYAELIKRESMILQPFQEQILTRGEVSHIVINGRCTHSVLKRAQSGDYRVQDDFGGTVHPYSASQQEKTFAEEVVSKCRPFPLYARVDVVWDNNGNLAVGELELIEPELWFRKNPAAAEDLAKAVCKLL